MVDLGDPLPHLIDVSLKGRVVISSKLHENGIVALFPHLYLVLIAEEHDLPLLGDGVDGAAGYEKRQREDNERDTDPFFDRYHPSLLTLFLALIIPFSLPFVQSLIMYLSIGYFDYYFMIMHAALP
jgi:hypothetical protein